MLNRRYLSGYLCVATLLPISSLQAQGPHRLPTLNVTHIEETLPVDLSRFGSRVEIITREQIVNTGAVDVAQALQMLVPGLHLAPKHGRFDYASASLQGSRSQDLLWLIDGVRINNRLFGTTSPLDSIPAHMIERIEVLKGGQSLLYGTDALGGAINIVTLGFRDEATGQLGLGTGSLGERQVNGLVRDRIGDNNRVVLFGSHAGSDGFTPFRDEHIEPSSRAGGTERGYNVTSLGGKYQRTFGPDARFTLQYIHTNAEVDFARPAGDFRAINDREQQILIAKWDQFLTDSFGFFIKAYYHDWSTEYTQVNRAADGTVNVGNDRDPWGFSDYGINAMARWYFADDSELVFGTDWQRYSGEDRVVSIETRTETVGAVFAQYRPVLPFAPNTAVAIGARYNQAELGGENLIWNLNLRQPLGQAHYVRGGVGTAFRLPDANQLYRQHPDHPRGNEDLDGEESLYAELGWGALYGTGSLALSWELSGFGREIRDLIKQDTVGGVSTYVNSDDTVTALGGEAIIELRLAAGWYTSLSATYARARERGSDQQINGIPEWFAKAVVGYDAPSRRYGMQLAAVHTGAVYQTLADIGRERYGEHTVADLAAYCRIGTALRHRLGFRLENVADVRYASGVARTTRDDGQPYRYDNLGTPRNVQFTYRYDF